MPLQDARRYPIDSLFSPAPVSVCDGPTAEITGFPIPCEVIGKTKKQLVQRILHLLENKPMTINELAVEVNSNWDTVSKALDLLKSVDVVVEVVDEVVELDAKGRLLVDADVG